MKVGDKVEVVRAVGNVYGEKRGVIVEVSVRVEFKDGDTRWFEIQELEAVDVVNLLGEVTDE